MKLTISLTFFLSAYLQCHFVTTATDWHYSGSNIARNKPTEQGPGDYNNNNASLAVDGNRGSEAPFSSCTHTSPTRNSSAFWRVNLDRSFYITGIIIINRHEQRFRTRLKNFIVYGNNSHILYDDFGKDRYNELEIKIQLDGKHSFSSIKIWIPPHSGDPDGGKSMLTLCEVEIYAAACGPPIHFSQNSNSYPINTWLTVYCDKGYTKYSSESYILCQSGVWASSSTPCSPVQCNYPGTPENGYYVRDDALYSFATLPYGSSIRGVCNKGYETNAYLERKCESDKSWTGQNLLCRPIRCTFPGYIENGAYVFSNGSQYTSGMVDYSTVLNINCEAGYQRVGPNQMNCQANKTWSLTTPGCTKRTCNSPERFKNGVYAIESQYPSENGKLIPLTDNWKSEYLTQIFPQCFLGHVLKSTNTSRVCLASGKWSGETPVCVPIKCKWPLNIHGGYYEASHNSSAEGLPYNTTLTAACNHTFKLSNNYQKLRCDENGNWVNRPATCEPLCPLPNVSNALVTRGISTLYEIGSSVRVACEEGFTLLPDQNITCLDNHKWSGTPDCLVVSSTDERTSDNSGMIAGVSVGTVFVIVSAFALAFLFYRRKKNKQQKNSGVAIRYNQPTNRGAENDQIGSWLAVTDEYAHIQKTPAGNGNVSKKTESAQVTNQGHTYNNTLIEIPRKIPIIPDQTYYDFTLDDKLPKTAIKVKDLSDLVLYRRNARESFEKQYKSLPQGMTGPHTEAVKTQNRGKNRYKNLYAYDDTRVILDVDGVTETDYINACYVHGFDRNRKYIASQGPTKEILSDFWKMVWQEDCNKIVMLTDLVEGGKDKCEQYWPDEGSETYGKITVSINATELFSEFMVRKFTIQKENSSSRTVSQFHFTAWPDKGIPKYASSLVQFMHKVKHAQVAESGSILVHCSAGVGRTGTFIALDILTDQGSAWDYVDVLGTVTTLRKQRVNLVQTLEQYIFVHHALVETLMLSTSALSAAKFPEAFRELLEVDQAHKKPKICLEFETLKQMSPVAEECQYVSSKLVRNRHKNRYSNVLPAEEFMPKLSSDDVTSDASYINAVFLPSYKEKKAFIITQTPLESTREDFWRLIWEHDIHTVVMMNNREEVQDAEVYWPGVGNEVKFGNMYIRNDGTEDINKHRKIFVTINYYLLTRNIQLIQFGGWQAQKRLPKSPDTILSLMEIVQKWQQQTGNHTILVHCMNGVDKSGLFCVISAVIERMKIEQDVAISQVMEEMRNAREQIIPSVEQYKFCHEAVLLFLDQNDTYANFAA